MRYCSHPSRQAALGRRGRRQIGKQPRQHGGGNARDDVLFEGGGIAVLDEGLGPEDIVVGGSGQAHGDAQPGGVRTNSGFDCVRRIQERADGAQRFAVIAEDRDRAPSDDAQAVGGDAAESCQELVEEAVDLRRFGRQSECFEGEDSEANGAVRGSHEAVTGGKRDQQNERDGRNRAVRESSRRGRRRRGLGQTVLNRREKSIAATRQGLDEAGTLGVVVEGGANLRDADVQRAVEIDGGFAPDFAAEALPLDHLAGAPRQDSQDLERLRREPDKRAVAPQFTGALIELEDPEAQHDLLSIWPRRAGGARRAR